MHELSIAHCIIEIVAQHLPVGETRGVESVTLRVGDFTGISHDALRFSFDLASEGTAVRGAKLVIESSPVVCRCGECGADFKAGLYITTCPKCGLGGVELISGNELNVVEVKLIEKEKTEKAGRARMI